MVNDSAWDMPKANWQQQGSFEIPEIPPTYEPDAEPLVCLPAINQHWLPYVMGALDQLRNPSSWIVADDDAMYTTLARVSKLREMIGIRAECMSYQLQFTEGCALQFSLDGGTTWADVAGWDTNFPVCNPPQTELRFTDGCELQDSFDGGATWAAVTGWGTNFGPCVQSHTPVIGLPPNPGDQTGDQLACSIAAYLTQSVLLGAMNKAVEAVNTDLTLLTFGASVLTLIPEFILVAAAYDAFSTIYGIIAEGTLSDYESALTNTALWADVQCCLYTQIKTDGFVTPANFGAIESCVAGITSAPSDVISAIGSFLSSLGATGLAQLSQIAGLETGADCTACGEYCRTWDFTTGSLEWSEVSAGGWSSAGGGGWYAETGSLYTALDFATTTDSSSPTVTSVHIEGDCGGTAGSTWERVIQYNTDGSVVPLPMGPFTDITVDLTGLVVNKLRLTIYSDGSSAGTIIRRVTVHGPGEPPAWNGSVAC